MTDPKARIVTLETRLKEDLAKQGLEFGQRLLDAEQSLSRAQQTSDTLEDNMRQSTLFMERNNHTITPLESTQTQNERAIKTLRSEQAGLENDRNGLRTQLVAAQEVVEQKVELLGRHRDFSLKKKN